jgi:hypothetical protein
MLPQHVVKFAQNPIDDGFWRGKTVAYFALQLAYFLGFDEVYVLGMDMTANHEWGSDAHCYELRRNPRFPDLEFPRAQTAYVQRGWPGHAEVRDEIRAFLIEARANFEAAGRRLVNDARSAMDALEQEDVIRTFSSSPHVVAFVPADGSSSRPLVLRALDTLLSCHAVDEVYLDTGSEEIARAAGDRKCKTIRRSTDWTADAGDADALLRCEASFVPDADVYIQARPSDSFPPPRAIDEAIFAWTQRPPSGSTAAATELMVDETSVLVLGRQPRMAAALATGPGR